MRANTRAFKAKPGIKENPESGFSVLCTGGIPREQVIRKACEGNGSPSCHPAPRRVQRKNEKQAQTGRRRWGAGHSDLAQCLPVLGASSSSSERDQHWFLWSDRSTLSSQPPSPLRTGGLLQLQSGNRQDRGLSFPFRTYGRWHSLDAETTKTVKLVY